MSPGFNSTRRCATKAAIVMVPWLRLITRFSFTCRITFRERTCSSPPPRGQYAASEANDRSERQGVEGSIGRQDGEQVFDSVERQRAVLDHLRGPRQTTIQERAEQKEGSPQA